MSVDILLGKISGSVARDDAEEGRASPYDVSIERGLLLPALLGTVTTAVCTLLVLKLGKTGRVGRSVERAAYRATWRDLARTQESPAETMSEIVYGGDRNP